MLFKRIITASILGPLFFGAIWWGNPLTNGAIFCGLSLIFLYECWGIWGGFNGGDTGTALLGLYCLLGVIPGVLKVLAGILLPFWVWAFWYLMIDYLLVLSCYPSLDSPFVRMAIAAFCHFYIGLFLYSSLSMLDLRQSNELVVYLLICVFSGDIFAYFGGKALGRHRLCPGVSPKKTIEGAICGLAASIAFGTMYMEISDVWGVGPWVVALASLGLGVTAQLGDLVESILKRTFNVKDSSNFLPGHGGFLDRFDGVILATPCLLLILQVT